MIEDQPTAEQEEFDPRVTVHNLESGEDTRIPRGAVSGLDDWIAAWEPNSELPSHVTFNAWQEVDDDHPAGAGQPGYRIVYKTIRTVPIPPLTVNGGSFRLTIGNGQVSWGQARFPNAMQHRREGEWLVPQWGTLHIEGNTARYEPEVDRTVAMAAHNETTPMCNYVELLYILPQTERQSYEDHLSSARARVAPLTAAIDVLYGERLLGPVITEEIGDIFEDWHWNRWLGGPTVGYEGQARIKRLDTMAFTAALEPVLKLQSERDEQARNRVRVACQWYWTADRESDPVMKFIASWLAIEALELGENANIAPIKAAVAQILSVDQRVISQAVGRTYGLRNKLLHGVTRTVSADDIARVDSLTRSLVELHLLGEVTHDTRNSLSAAFIAGREVSR
ncbi:HEPN domain-containing protein [Microbacterium testaceum]|uniref:HEPN domain-containing protein n=1 Tax=Microbacterium testaceum TaxID=2033 RepID=UPI000B2B1A3A|nr:HEPN domain-containing protein [Microbacterium testaceum]